SSKLPEKSGELTPQDRPPNVSEAQSDCSISPILERARIAFRRDLPQLLKERDRQWVAYHGDECLGFNDSSTPLYQECGRRGYPAEEVLLECIYPEVEELDLQQFLGR